MAPQRRILRQQLEVLMDYLENNREMSNGFSPGTPATHQATRQKWTLLAKQLNAVHGGTLKTPDGWKKYWFEWRHKCRKKAADSRRLESNGNRFVPLTDLEVRVIELSGQGSVGPSASSRKTLGNFLGDDSDSEHQPLETLKSQVTAAKLKTRQSTNRRSGTLADDGQTTPPPQWAMDLEERRIAAEERMADALESLATTIRMQEERRSILDERITDALTAMAGTIQDLNSGIQETVQLLQRNHPLQINGEIKTDVFL